MSDKGTYRAQHRYSLFITPEGTTLEDQFFGSMILEKTDDLEINIKLPSGEVVDIIELLKRAQEYPKDAE